MNPHLLKRICAVAAAIFACVNVQAQTRADYRCDASGTGFRVTYSNGSAQLRLPGGETQLLRQQRMGSGFAYEGGGYSLRGKGDRATLVKMSSRNADECRALRPPR
jgi:membrane-bound inhibitor of C-type lysozyme